MDSDWKALKEEIAALDNLIQYQSSLIKKIKDSLKNGAESVADETALLGELTAELVVLRQLQDERFARLASVRRLADNGLLDESGESVEIAVTQTEAFEISKYLM
jgi:hypothetical protein